MPIIAQRNLVPKVFCVFQMDLEEIIEMSLNPIARRKNIVVQELENEVLIYDLNINKAYCLNRTSALVYQLADGNKTIPEISKLMSAKLKTLVSEDLIWLALEEFKKDNLLENNEEFPNHFTGLSRREAVKRVGLASMVMLPLISSVVAPISTDAASGAVCGGGCTTLGQSPCNGVVGCICLGNPGNLFCQ